jgi:phosphate transport system protein
MLKLLFQAFKNTDDIDSITEEFMEMLNLTRDMWDLIQPSILDGNTDDKLREELYKMDVRVNKLERSIRKQIISHLNAGGERVSYCLLMMSVIKDAERIGDYLKNISEVDSLTGASVPDGTFKQNLEELIALASTIIHETPQILEDEDAEKATDLLQKGRVAAQQCDQLLLEVAKSNCSPAETTAIVLLTRFHKRLGAHAMNILSSVVMPLHKIDFYDGRLNI